MPAGFRFLLGGAATAAAFPFDSAAGSIAGAGQ